MNSTAPERPQVIVLFEGMARVYDRTEADAYIDALESEVAQLRAEIANAKILITQAYPYLQCDSECGCSGDLLATEMKAFVAPPSERDAQEGK